MAAELPLNWRPPEEWHRFRTIDAHVAGEPLRILLDGFPSLPGETILEKRAYAREHHDELRRVLMWEPRGHADMYGCLPTEPVTPDGDVGVLFLHNEGYSTMCGHGIIGLAQVGLETGLLHAAAAEADVRVVRIDSPAGRVTARARCKGEHVESVCFDNVPSFLLEADAAVEVAGLGKVRYDLAYGGAFYAYVNAGSLGLELTPQWHDRLIEAGMRIKREVMKHASIVHPDGDADLNFLYGVIFVRSIPNERNEARESAHSRNVCVFAEGELDRSPTGTGVSGRAAIHHAKGELEEGRPIVIESILGTSFTVEVAGTTKVGSLDAVVPRVEGRAWITGRHDFWVDPRDPLREGFFLR